MRAGGGAARRGAFPLADALLATAAIGGGTALLRGAPAGVFVLALAGAMSLYLGVLDVSFYGRQGLYTPLIGDGGFELVSALTVKDIKGKRRPVTLSVGNAPQL